MTEASQVRAQLRSHVGPLLRLVATSAPVAVANSDVPDHHWCGRGASGWIESKLIPASGRRPDHFTLGQLMWGEEEVAAGGRWHLLGLVQSAPARWVLYDTVGARAWFEGAADDRWLFSVSGRFPTRELLRALIGPTKECASGNPTLTGPTRHPAATRSCSPTAARERTAPGSVPTAATR